MRIIGAGFGRTGTASLQAALEQLGFKQCYHMFDTFRNPSHVDIWHDAAFGKPVDWLAFFEAYEATVDWPGCSFYKELMELYPDATVILNVRDPERWYDSTFGTIYAIRSSFLRTLLQMLFPHIRKMYEVIDKLIWDGAFEGRFEDRAHAIAVFNNHIETVKQHVPADRLLVYQVKDGWGPLCAFLDAPVPKTPFPHLNDAKRMQRMMFWGPIMIFALVVAIIGLLVWLLGLFF
ncbi:MAG: sulfotransferase family protein [Chloroflexota bacterium]